jgi:hypothetical protein
MSRIQDAGLDFTGRTNFIAHHLVLAAEDFRQFPIPPIILRDWPGWVKSWTREPTVLESEDWSGLTSLGNKSSVPARTWQRVTGDSVNGYGLLEARAGATFRVDDQTNETVLGLFAESIELLEVRDARRDFRAAALQYTFTTSMQEQDNPSDFRWRCIHSDNPAANRLATPDCRALSAVRPAKWTAEEAAFANDGRKAPKFVTEPQDVQIIEGQEARFQAKADGIPNPTYQWYSVDRTDNGQPLTDATNPELALSNSTLGKFRYVVRVSNSAGDTVSRTATLSVEQKPRLAQASVAPNTRSFSSSHQKSESDIERQRNRLDAEQAEKQFRHRQQRNRAFVIIVIIVAIGCALFVRWKRPSAIRDFVARLSGDAPTVNSNAIPDSTLNVQPNQQNNLPLKGTTSNEAALLSNTPIVGQSDQHHKPEFFGDLPPLPKPWERQPIGAVSNPYAEYIDQKPPPRLEMSALAEGLNSNSDNFLFIFKAYDALQISATLTNSPLLNQGGAGLMIRKGKAQNAPFLFIGVSSGQIIVCRRDIVDGIVTNQYRQKGNEPAITFALKNDNNSVMPAYSIGTWNGPLLQTFKIDSTNDLLVGLALWSGSGSNSAKACFIGAINGSGTVGKKN